MADAAEIQAMLLLPYSHAHRKYRLAPDYPGKMRSLGSTIAHMRFAATGDAHEALLGRVHFWDLAPGLALLRQNGGMLRYLRGVGPAELERLRPGPRIEVHTEPALKVPTSFRTTNRRERLRKELRCR